MITVWGLKNCDTCRRALKWLAQEDIEHRFLDVRMDGFDAARIGRWSAAVGWEQLLNRRSTTWRGLADSEKANVDGTKAVGLMTAHPALIKRPVFEIGDTVVVGFTDDEKRALQPAA